MKIPVKRLSTAVPLPEYAHEGDAGIDLYSTEYMTIDPGGGRALVGTGIAVAIPPGHVGFVVPRSGLAIKKGVTIVNSPGTIDAAYRGEIKVILANTDKDEPYYVRRGDRIAQLIVQQFVPIEWDVVDELDDWDRGGGFGHSGR